MKVLFLNPIGTLGGAERALLDIIASIKEASLEVEFSVVALEDGPLLSEARRLGAAADCLGVPKFLARLGDSGGINPLRMALAATALPPWLSRFSRLLAERRPDVIHANGFKAHVLAAVASPRSPGALVWHFHDFISQRPIMRRLLPRLRHRARLAIAVSEAVARDVRNAIQGLEVRTILNGVRTCDFQPERVKPANLDKLARLPPAPPGTLRVGLVSTFASWKGHDLFLEAAKHIDDPRVRFFLVGGPVYSTRGSQRTPDELRGRIGALGLGSRCGLIPFQHETAPIYVALDVLVHASTKPEPFGRTVAEGMSSGRAVLAADAGGVPEQIVNEVSGLLFPPGDVMALVSQLRRLLDSEQLRRRLGAAAKERATSTLDFRRLGPETLEAYRTLLRVPPAPRASKA